MHKEYNDALKQIPIGPMPVIGLIPAMKDHWYIPKIVVYSRGNDIECGDWVNGLWPEDAIEGYLPKGWYSVEEPDQDPDVDVLYLEANVMFWQSIIQPYATARIVYPGDAG
jgi:hypothetical protein